MDPRKAQFLTAVVGADGASALLKAAAAHPDLEWAVFPRVVMAWLEVVGLGPYAAALPGVSGTHLALSKAESGFSGSVTVGDVVYRFEDQTLFHVAGGVAVALGGGGSAPPLRSPALAKLGKSIDLLVKARTLRKAQEELAKAEPRGKCYTCGKGRPRKELDLIAGHDRCKACREKSEKQHEEFGRSYDRAGVPAPKTEKAEHKGGAKGPGGPGAAAAPMAPQGPQVPNPTQPKPPQARPRKPQIKVSKAEAAAPCRACGGTTFRGDRFVGCVCLQDLAKHAATILIPDGYLVSGPWDQEAFVTLAEALKAPR